MKGVRWIRKGCRTIASNLIHMCVRVKYYLCAPLGGPTHCLGITPSLVADYYSESKRTCLKYSSSLTRHIRQLLRRIDLLLILPARHRAIRIDDQSADL